MKSIVKNITNTKFVLSAVLFVIGTLILNTQTQAAVNPFKKQLRSIFSLPHKKVCDTQKNGFAECHAHVVTDKKGKPKAANTPYASSYGPAQFHTAYNLPCTPFGSVQSICSAPVSFGPQTIAIVDAYNAPTIQNDIHIYSNYYGLPDCTVANGCLLLRNQNGGTTLPSQTNSGWAFETSLDVEVAHAMCQTCKILLIEANSNSFLDLATGVNTAANMGATAISNSYGGSEWSTETSYDTYFDHPGIAVTVSAGDNGYGTEFPAASASVVAVGGTTLQVYADNTFANETVWNGTGSGCSSYETANPWQINLGNWSQTNCGSYRGVADIAADADPNTGAAVYDSTPYSGSTGWWQVGGTSLAAPIVASEYALAGGVSANTNAASLLYANNNANNSHDTTSGSNGQCNTIMCFAGLGYDGPTGLGSLYGVTALNTTVINTPTPTDMMSPTPTDTPTPTDSLPSPTLQPTATPSPTPIIDTIKPTVAFTYPLNGSIVPRRTKITATVSASDNVGVARVRIYRNNSLICTVTNAPYSCSVYTANNAGITVTYKAIAYDAAGNAATNIVKVKTK